MRWFPCVGVQLLESAFKKETVGLVTREQFVEKVSLVHAFLSTWRVWTCLANQILAGQVFHIFIARGLFQYLRLSLLRNNLLMIRICTKCALFESHVYFYRILALQFSCFLCIRTLGWICRDLHLDNLCCDMCARFSESQFANETWRGGEGEAGKTRFRVLSCTYASWRERVMVACKDFLSRYCLNE